MDAQAVGRNTLGEGDFGEDFQPASPHRLQTLKRRTVLVALGGQPLVGLGHVHGYGTGRRPHAQLGCRVDRAGAQGALGVQHPVRIGLAVARIHREAAVTGLVGDAHDHLHLDSPSAGMSSGARSIGSSITVQPLRRRRGWPSPRKPRLPTTPPRPPRDRSATAGWTPRAGRSAPPRRSRAAAPPPPTTHAH